MVGISKAERERRAAETEAQGDTQAQEGAAAEQAGDAAQTDLLDDKSEPDQATQTVRMERDPGAYPEPHAADVHPDEVANFAAGGWVISA
jgi:regulator of protease activity HflC (stomatin/prohibitin superfamily)